VITENVNTNINSLPLKGIEQGVYICKVTNEKGDIIYNNRIVVIK